MSKEEQRLLTITTEDGSEVLCEIMFTHYSEEFNKHYVVFTEQGTNNASAAQYIPTEDGNGTLAQIESDEEWTMLEDLLADYADNHEEGHEGCGGGCEHCSGECDEDCEDDECETEGCNCHHHKE